MGSSRFAARSGNEPQSGNGRRPGENSGRGGKRSGSEDQLISRLRGLPAGPSPDSHFTDELRSQLVSIAPRIIAESASDNARFPAGTDPVRSGFLGRLRRPLIAFVGAAAVLAMLLSLAVWMAHGALPGQSLYGVKRASENFQLSLASSDADKAKAYLDQATHRASESTKLAGSSGLAGSPHLSGLLASTLNSADADTRSGIALIGKLSVARSSTAPMAGVATWVSQQSGRLDQLRQELPSGPDRSRAVSSLALLQQVSTRLASWQTALTCGCKAVKTSDALGPVVTDK
ncbi:MAG: DUF5667 domain-containing protein [Jatrophihabitantaceae bacterium]